MAALALANVMLDEVSTGAISQYVIDRMIEWQGWLENEAYDKEQRYHMPVFNSRDRPEAAYTVQCLSVVLPLVVTRTNPQKTTVLNFRGSLLDESIAECCDFLRPPINKYANASLTLHLGLGLPPHQVSLLLESLHTNTSVEELCFDRTYHGQLSLWICNLLHQKEDFIALRFQECHLQMESILPGLRRPHAHLQKLEFSGCGVDDAQVGLVVEAFRGGNLPSLKDLDLSYNVITSDGLHFLAEPHPVAFRQLQKLNLNGNEGLLADLVIVQLFVKNRLESDDMILELHIAGCGEHRPAIIKACESDKSKLQVLDVSCEFSDNLQHEPAIHEQLVESIPKMTKLQHLLCDSEFFNVENQTAANTALHRNTSIVELTVDACRVDHLRHLFDPILKRNRILKHADALLALQPKTGMPIGSKSGLWCKAFAKMAPPPPPPASNDGNGTVLVNSGHLGASAIFKILQNRHDAILEKQLRRPAVVVAAADTDNDDDDGNGGRTKKNDLETADDTAAGARKCQRLV